MTPPQVGAQSGLCTFSNHSWCFVTNTQVIKKLSNEKKGVLNAGPTVCKSLFIYISMSSVLCWMHHGDIAVRMMTEVTHKKIESVFAAICPMWVKVKRARLNVTFFFKKSVLGHIFLRCPWVTNSKCTQSTSKTDAFSTHSSHIFHEMEPRSFIWGSLVSFALVFYGHNAS